MKHAPKKIHIKERGRYMELPYMGFCCRRGPDQTYMDKLSILVQDCLPEVVKEQYTDLHRDKERWCYLQKLDTKNGLLSLDGFTNSEESSLDPIADEVANIMETVISAVMMNRLRATPPLLLNSEQASIHITFSDGPSECGVGARLGITQNVANKRKTRTLTKLKEIIGS